MRVAIDYRPALLGSSGIGRAVRELTAALASSGEVDLRLFGHSLAAARVAGAVPAGARLHRLPIPGRWLPFLCRHGLGAETLAGGAEVFHWTDYVQPPVRRARAVLTVHDLAFVHDQEFHGANAAVLRARTAAAAAAAAAVVVPSRATAADVAAHLPGTARTEVIPFGCDHVPRARPARPALAGAEHVLCLGTIEPRKNHRALLRAFAALPAPRPLLLVVGQPGWECAAIVAELRAAERAGIARWLPAADDALVFALLAHARALVYPSLWEGFGFPPLEAMALGVPALVHDCAPLRELVDDAALLVDARSDEALGDGLARVLGDGQLRARLAAAGPRRAGVFRWRDCARAHARLYAEVAR